MTSSTGGSTSGIKLKFSLGSLSSSQGPSTPTPTVPKTKIKLDTTRISNGSVEKLDKGKGKAVNGHAEVATHQPTILRLTTSSSRANGTTAESPTTVANGSEPTPKAKKPPKLKKTTTPKLDQPPTPLDEVDHSPPAGPSTPTPLPPQHVVGTAPLPPYHRANSSTVSTPVTGRTRTPTSTVSRAGQHVSRHGKILGRPRGSKSKPASRQPLKPSEKTGKHVFRRPSAIPSRLLSSTPSTPRLPLFPNTASPVTPAARSASPVKQEPDMDVDPIAKSLSPAAADVTTPKSEEGVAAEPQTPLADTPKVVKGKKPIKELMQRIMVQLVRRDDYAFFLEPVDLEVIPGYLEAIGGEDKMMDLGTMQGKVDNGDYADFDQFTDDLRTLVTAAKTFNPEGSLPYIYAQKILVLGEKQIEKSRPLVATPEPTPERGLSDSGTPWSAREGTMGPDHTEEAIPANLYIPEEMLQFPPNSPYALAVGWNLTGGRRVYSKRQIRGREKFSGKWRHWDLDGSRDWAEVEDPEKLLDSQATTLGNRTIIDWKGLRRSGRPWWDFEIGGPNGVPPFAFTPFPRPPDRPTRVLNTFAWGPYPDCELELAQATSRQSLPPMEVLRETLRPSKPKPRPAPGFVNIYYDSQQVAGDWLREMVYGDATGEAYVRSVKRFVTGAMASSKPVESDNISLSHFVKHTWHNGILGSDTGDMVHHSLQEFRDLWTAQKRGVPLSNREEHLLQLAQNAYRRQAMRYLTRPGSPLDLGELLKDSTDFSYSGIGNKGGVAEGFEWIQREIIRLSNGDIVTESVNGKRKRIKEDGEGVKRIKLDSSNFDSKDSSPLSEVPDSPRPEETGSEGLSREEAMTKLRLELVALCKYYPLSALKKMSKEDATRLLPVSVRQLMSKPE